jgi:Leucine-rich repeat (LRR) protein
LNKNYPKRSRKEIKKLDISGKKLESALKLSGFGNLEEIECSDNEIFKIINIDLLNYKKLTYINLRDNCIKDTEISIFSKFVQLKTLYLGRTENRPIYNNFFGSLKCLINLKKLETLCINDTKINEGFEYLPDNITEFFVSDSREKLEKGFTEEKGKLQLFIEELEFFHNDVRL